MSTSASTQTVLTIVKDGFAEVLTKGTLFPTTKPTDWNVIIIKKALLKTARTPSNIVNSLSTASQCGAILWIINFSIPYT
jgi:hypothetical protein